MPNYTLSINIAAAELERAYRTPSKVLRSRSDCGKVIQLPFSILRRLTIDGTINGRFSISADAQGKLIDIRRL